MIHPKTLLISRHFYSLESYVWRSIYNLKIDIISTCDIPLDRSFLKLWNGIRRVMQSTDRRLELKEKTSMAQNAWQASVYANGLNSVKCKIYMLATREYITVHLFYWTSAQLFKLMYLHAYSLWDQRSLGTPSYRQTRRNLHRVQMCATCVRIYLLSPLCITDTK